MPFGASVNISVELQCQPRVLFVVQVSCLMVGEAMGVVAVAEATQNTFPLAHFSTAYLLPGVRNVNTVTIRTASVHTSRMLGCGVS